MAVPPHRETARHGPRSTHNEDHHHARVIFLGRSAVPHAPVPGEPGLLADSRGQLRRADGDPVTRPETARRDRLVCTAWHGMQPRGWTLQPVALIATSYSLRPPSDLWWQSPAGERRQCAFPLYSASEESDLAEVVAEAWDFDRHEPLIRRLVRGITRESYLDRVRRFREHIAAEQGRKAA